MENRDAKLCQIAYAAIWAVFFIIPWIIAGPLCYTTYEIRTAENAVFVYTPQVTIIDTYKVFVDYKDTNKGIVQSFDYYVNLTYIPVANLSKIYCPQNASVYICNDCDMSAWYIGRVMTGFYKICPLQPLGLQYQAACKVDPDNLGRTFKFSINNVEPLYNCALVSGGICVFANGLLITVACCLGLIWCVRKNCAAHGYTHSTHSTPRPPPYMPPKDSSHLLH